MFLNRKDHDFSRDLFHQQLQSDDYYSVVTGSRPVPMNISNYEFRKKKKTPPAMEQKQALEMHLLFKMVIFQESHGIAIF